MKHRRLRRRKALVVFIDGPVVRLATEQDLEQIAGLYERSFPEHIMVHRGLLNDPGYLVKRIQSPDEVWAVEECEGTIRGIAALAVIAPVGLGEIERVCVGQPHRGNGVAGKVCEYLVDQAKELDLGFVEAFARGDQPAMQRTFEKLGFKVYGVAPRFEVVHGDRIVREQFVHMGLELKPETIDEKAMSLIAPAQEAYNLMKRK